MVADDFNAPWSPCGLWFPASIFKYPYVITGPFPTSQYGAVLFYLFLQTCSLPRSILSFNMHNAYFYKDLMKGLLMSLKWTQNFQGQYLGKDNNYNINRLKPAQLDVGSPAQVVQTCTQGRPCSTSLLPTP